jgi:hypothetical protein
VDHSLFCNTSLGGVLLSRSELVCYCRGRDCCAEQSVLCRLSVCKAYQSVHLHVHLYQQRLDSFSPSCGLDVVRFFSVLKETDASL